MWDNKIWVNNCMLQGSHLRVTLQERDLKEENIAVSWRADALTSGIANFWSKLSFLTAVVWPITGNVSLLLSLHQQSRTLSLMRIWCVSPYVMLPFIKSLFSNHRIRHSEIIRAFTRLIYNWIRLQWSQFLRSSGVLRIVNLPVSIFKLWFPIVTLEAIHLCSGFLIWLTNSEYFGLLCFIF